MTESPKVKELWRLLVEHHQLANRYFRYYQATGNQKAAEAAAARYNDLYQAYEAACAAEGIPVTDIVARLIEAARRLAETRDAAARGWDRLCRTNQGVHSRIYSEALRADWLLEFAEAAYITPEEAAGRVAYEHELGCGQLTEQ